MILVNALFEGQKSPLKKAFFFFFVFLLLTFLSVFLYSSGYAHFWGLKTTENKTDYINSERSKDDAFVSA